MIDLDAHKLKIKMEKEPPPTWLLSFGDLTAILTTFFVLLFSMSTLQTDRWKALGLGHENPETAPEKNEKVVGKSSSILPGGLAPALPLGYLRKVLQEKFKEDPILNNIVVYPSENSVILSLPDETLFKSGGAVLTRRAKTILFRIGGVISTIGNQVQLEGHSSPSEDDNEIIRSDWKLSLARALAVSNELKKSGYKKPLVVIGRGASHFDLLNERYPSIWHAKMARRVDIIIRPEEVRSR
mgnify:CR=1 FL=1